ncbi:hypothetical protein EG832_21945, partial [bacterium]|nr:hypothetical protein [bacterium]
MDHNILLALAGAGFNAGNDLLYRKASIMNRSASLLPFYLISAVSASAIAMLFIIIKSGWAGLMFFGTADLFYGAVLGVLSFVTYILYLSSFSGDNTSVCVTIYRMNMVPAILLAVIFMGEVIDLKRGAAIVCCIISMILLGSRHSAGPEKGRKIMLSIGACMTGGVLSFVNKVAMIHGADSFR